VAGERHRAKVTGALSSCCSWKEGMHACRGGCTACAGYGAPDRALHLAMALYSDLSSPPILHAIGRITRKTRATRLSLSTYRKPTTQTGGRPILPRCLSVSALLTGTLSLAH